MNVSEARELAHAVKELFETAQRTLLDSGDSPLI